MRAVRRPFGLGPPLAAALPKLQFPVLQIDVRGACECEEGPPGEGPHFSVRNVRWLPDEPAGEQWHGQCFLFFPPPAGGVYFPMETKRGTAVRSGMCAEERSGTASHVVTNTFVPANVVDRCPWPTAPEGRDRRPFGPLRSGHGKAPFGAVL